MAPFFSQLVSYSLSTRCSEAHSREFLMHPCVCVCVFLWPVDQCAFHVILYVSCYIGFVADLPPMRFAYLWLTGYVPWIFPRISLQYWLGTCQQTELLSDIVPIAEPTSEHYSSPTVISPTTSSSSSDAGALNFISLLPFSSSSIPRS